MLCYEYIYLSHLKGVKKTNLTQRVSCFVFREYDKKQQAFCIKNAAKYLADNYINNKQNKYCIMLWSKSDVCRKMDFKNQSIMSVQLLLDPFVCSH